MEKEIIMYETEYTKKKGIYSKTLVLDSSYMPRSIITSLRAFDIIYKGNAERVVDYPVIFKVTNPDVKYYKPSIIRIFKYLNLNFHKSKLTKQNVFIRDNYECVYCGDTDRKTLTLDHVVPQSKGGPNSWSNLVTACKPCNNEKDDLDVKEWGKPHPNPRRPHYLMLIQKAGVIPDEWKDYLFSK